MDIFEAYSDLFEVTINPYGMVINFNLSPASPRSDTITVGRIRLSWEMGKVLTFMMQRLIKKRETETGVSYPIPADVLNSLQIAKEDWDALWTSPPKFKG